MAESDYVRRLNYPTARRRKKLIKLKRQMQICTWGSIFSAGLVTLSLLLFIQWGENNTLGAVAQSGSLLPASGTASLTRPVVLFLVSAAGLAMSSAQYARFKAKYDKLRHYIESLFPLKDMCTCHWSTCTCIDDFIMDMDKNYHINLNY